MRTPRASRTLTVIVALLATAVTIAACGSSDSGDDIATADTTTTTTTTTPVEGDSGPDGGSEAEGAETGDGDEGTDGGVVQTEADGETADPAESDRPTTTSPASGSTSAGQTGGSAGSNAGTEGDGDTGSTPGGEDPTAPTVTAPAPDEVDLPDDEDPEDDPATDGRYELEAPTGALTDLASGSGTDLADELTGTYTLLWFWTPTTPSSGQEVPLVERFADTFAGSVEVVAIGSGGERAEADAFRQSSGLSVTTLWAPSTDSADHYGVERVPSAVLIDRAGTIIGRWTGLSEEAFRLAERLA
ncbi:MAG: TlpA disulfide reductase family protein [Actinomycetota bacterium]